MAANRNRGRDGEAFEQLFHLQLSSVSVSVLFTPGFEDGPEGF
jgi:hypothetical protein